MRTGEGLGVRAWVARRRSSEAVGGMLRPGVTVRRHLSPTYCHPLRRIGHLQPKRPDGSLEGPVPGASPLPGYACTAICVRGEHHLDTRRHDLARCKTERNIISKALRDRVGTGGGRRGPGRRGRSGSRARDGRRRPRVCKRLLHDRRRRGPGRTPLLLRGQDAEFNRENRSKNGPGDQNGSQRMHVTPRYRSKDIRARRERRHADGSAEPRSSLAPFGHTSFAAVEAKGACVGGSTWSGA